MEREIDLNQISDGRLYLANDMVRTGCNECAGCSSCCRGMGDSIILDPYDMYSLQRGLGITFESMMQDQVELNVVDGIIQPNIKMQQGKDCCAFLSEAGRCTIHAFRQGFCRMFPLGRIYEQNSFRYFLQVHECAYPNKTKVKVKKWLEIPELGKYETYIKEWHFFLKEVQEIIKKTQNDAIVKNLNMYLLNQFYVNPYDVTADFYHQFGERMEEAKEIVKSYR
ncbi:MAG: YkgJ family cysteine cluster protein [Lachnospiraceae bacterium]|nr:YkgJ family cysteine cluster protein [Lachnospiraceae bacterium]